MYLSIYPTIHASIYLCNHLSVSCIKGARLLELESQLHLVFVEHVDPQCMENVSPRYSFAMTPRLHQVRQRERAFNWKRIGTLKIVGSGFRHIYDPLHVNTLTPTNQIRFALQVISAIRRSSFNPYRNLTETLVDTRSLPDTLTNLNPTLTLEYPTVLGLHTMISLYKSLRKVGYSGLRYREHP